MKITIEQEGKEPIVYEGEIALVSVGTIDRKEGTIKSRHFSKHYDGIQGYAVQCRLLTGQAAELNRNFNDQLQFKGNTAKAKGEPK